MVMAILKKTRVENDFNLVVYQKDTCELMKHEHANVETRIMVQT